MVCKFKKFFAFLIIAFSLFFLGSKVNAVGIVYLTCDNNGCEVVNRCDNQYFCQSPLLNSNEIQFNFDNANFTIDNTYNFNLNFTTTSPALYGTPNIYDCNLAINGSFVVATRNSGRTGYECGSDRCDASFVSSMSYTMTQSYTNAPNFIRCHMNTTRYNYTQFTYSTNSNQGSVINAINQNGNNQIQTANNNAQQNNANRDSNTNRLISKLGDVISGITNTGSDIVSGIVSGINTAKNFILNKMSDIITAIGDIVSPITTAIGNIVSPITTAIGNIVSPIVNAVTTIGSNIVNGISTGVSNIINKLSDLFISCGTGKNLLRTTANTQTKNGVTFTRNADYSWTLNGTSTEYTSIALGTVPLTADTTYTLSGGSVSGTCFIQALNGETFPFTQNGYITFVQTNAYTATIYIVVNANKTLNNVTLKPMIELGDEVSPYEPYEYVCKPTIFSFFERFTDFVSNLFDNTIGNVWENLNNINKIQDTPVTDLILMPLTLIDAFHTALSSNSCSGYTIPFDFTGGNNTLTLPCINLQNYLGSTLWSAIDLILMGLMIYSIAMMCVSFFESWSSLHDTFDFLYNVGPNKGR